MSIQLPAITALSSLKFRLRNWCALVALITAFAFVALVSVSVTHHHTTFHETQDCSLCSVVSDKVGSGFSAAVMVVTRFVILFAVATAVLRSTLVTAALPLPPGCGPPGNA